MLEVWKAHKGIIVLIVAILIVGFVFFMIYSQEMTSDTSQNEETLTQTNDQTREQDGQEDLESQDSQEDSQENMEDELDSEKEEGLSQEDSDKSSDSMDNLEVNSPSESEDENVSNDDEDLQEDLEDSLAVTNQLTADQRQEILDSYSRSLSDEEETVFFKEDIPDDIAQVMTGISWQASAPVTLDELQLLHLTYVDFEGNSQVGIMVVNASVADDVLAIFQDIYQAGFPIERMTLVDEYDGDDDLSMEANNTSSFNYRKVTGSSTSLSNHAYGLAIDINPVQNPYIKGSTLLPENGADYENRQDVRSGMIISGDAVYNAFKSRGWTWGGDWNTMKDYQHFEKTS